MDEDATTGDADANYSLRVGHRLRAVRKQRNLSLQAVEARSEGEFRASVLGAYERGERAISVARLQRLAALYDVSVDYLLPGHADAAVTLDLRETAVAGAPPSWPVAGDEGPPVVIDLDGLERLPADERELIGRYVGMIQVKRQDFTSRRIAIRRDDLRALAFLFETTPAIMRRRLDQLGVSIRA
ncbi:MAG TPA: transcriptional regulator [Acidimicrobiales bacterium]|nr:transcriptional regulator [Acidimicrobiales bacterium]